MKRVIIAFGILVVAIIGIMYFSNKDQVMTSSETSKYDINLKQIESNVGSGAIIVDVRTEDEYNADHAVGAINIPLNDIQDGKYPEIAKDDIVYVYCHSGNRAAQAKTILEQAGYAHVVSLTSLYKWVAMGGKTAGDNPTCSVDNEASC